MLAGKTNGATAHRTLLVVDDDAVQRLVMREVARRLGFDVDCAASADEASALMSTHEYQIVTIDLALGEQDGVQILRDIEATGHRPEILVVSGLDDRVREAAVRYGQSIGLSTIGEIKKPIDIVALRKCLLTGSSHGARPVAPETPPEIRRDELEAAVEAGEIFPVYQPKVELRTGNVVGVEVFARWKNPSYGTLPAAAFITHAGQWGLAEPLTHRIMQEVMRDAAAWHQFRPDLSIAINIPATFLNQTAFPAELERFMATIRLPADNLIIEVRDAAALNETASGDVLTRLRIKGIQLSLDNFGIGSASLLTMLRMPFSELKIDRSFVSDCDRDPYAWKIVRATVSLAREFGMKCVAEGVERQSVADLLIEAGCELAQGELFFEPMSAEKFTNYLADQAQAKVAKLTPR